MSKFWCNCLSYKAPGDEKVYSASFMHWKIVNRPSAGIEVVVFVCFLSCIMASAHSITAAADQACSPSGMQHGIQTRFVVWKNWTFVIFISAMYQRFLVLLERVPRPAVHQSPPLLGSPPVQPLQNGASDCRKRSLHRFFPGLHLFPKLLPLPIAPSSPSIYALGGGS